MQFQDVWLLLAFFVLVLAPAPFLGRYLYRVMEGQKTLLTPLLQPVERLCYRLGGVDERAEQNWQTYALALLAFTAVSLLVLFSILLMQGSLPLNPQHLPGMEWTLAFNTAVSFVTNTNWQAYSGEASLSYFSQMVGLGVQNFVSPAVGLAVLVVFCRGIARKSTNNLGNFWVDLTRATLYGLLPFCLILALLLVWQGVPQTFLDNAHAVTLHGADQTIPLGPAASQIAIKQLGTNGGGFFGVNSAHPFENPTIASNLAQCLSLLLRHCLSLQPGHVIFNLGQRLMGHGICLAPRFLANMVDQQIARRSIEIALGVVDALAGRFFRQAQEALLHQVCGQLRVPYLARQIPAQGIGMLEKQALEIHVRQTDSLECKGNRRAS